MRDSSKFNGVGAGDSRDSMQDSTQDSPRIYAAKMPTPTQDSMNLLGDSPLDSRDSQKNSPKHSREDSALDSPQVSPPAPFLIRAAKFEKSIENITQSPAVLYSEVAFLGRSNVGKSSLINALLNNKNLAKSSATPGKTRLINFFFTKWQRGEEVFDLRFIDFPGFGYAKVSKAQKSAWDRHLSEFLKRRESIKLFIHLIDARHPNLPQDGEIAAFLERVKRPDCEILRVFTKADKLTNAARKALASAHTTAAKDDKKSIELLRNAIVKSLFGARNV